MSRRAQFETIKTEGALLPTELLQRIRERDKDLGGLRGEDYGLPPNEPLNEAIVRSYNRLVGAWTSFHDARTSLTDGDPGTTVTRDRWLLVLLQELGYGRVQRANAVEIEGRSYPVSHAWQNAPIHLVGCNVPLGTRSPGVAGAATQSPHGIVQELLNQSDERLWAIVSNGLQLRVLRDNSSLTRQAYVEFDLEQMMDGDIYADFALLWMLCHASRVEGEKPHECWLERWSQEAAKQGTRALEGLRAGVETAIAELGSGFLTSGRNSELKAALRSGELSTQEYYRELLRLVYRLLFLFVAEDRGLLHHPDAGEEARSRYGRWYSTRRLRDLSEKRRGTKHGDLWESLSFVMRALSADEGCVALGLPALGSFLWSERALPQLERAQLPNRAVLEAVRALATVREGKVLRAVDYKSLGSEELGSVYESLLELHPQLDPDAGTFTLDTAAGNERKTTGSYYTPTSLISVLLDSALDPVLDEAAAKGEEAILDLKIVDPACGSGHFLVAAAHRIAKRLASARTGDEEPSPEVTRHALRDVVSRCIYGVDLNPMAVELCKVSLWMEALEPGKPLSFLDAHIRRGNSLIGATPELLADGVPDEAFSAIEGDDKKVASALRKRNRDEREGQLSLEDEVVELESALAANVAAVEAASDDSLPALREKMRLFANHEESTGYRHAKLLADAWCAAFFQSKAKAVPARITDGVVRRIAQNSTALPEAVRREIEMLSADYGFFHWHIEFPGVFGGADGGFDVVLGNPPWDQIQLDPREFFATIAPEIANAPNMAARDRLLADLPDDQPLLNSYAAARRKIDALQQFFHGSGAFPLTSYGRLNLAPLFVEQMRRLCARGFVGCIVPSGIATDSFNQYLFQDLVAGRSLVSLYDFRNSDRLFYDVGHRRFKFCLLTLSTPKRPQVTSKFIAFAEDVSDLTDPDRLFELTAADFYLLNPNTKTWPIFRTRRDAALTKAIYERTPVLVERSTEVRNPWNFDGVLMFMMNTDSGLFVTQDQAQTGTQARVSLYEAKMVHQYTHRFGDYALRKTGSRDTELPTATPELLLDPLYSLTPRYWVAEEQIHQRLRGRWTRQWLVAWRDICRSTDERTVIAAVVPAVAVGATLRLALVHPADLAHCLLANLNSFVLDYVARQKVGGTHLSQHVMDQLPLLPPSAYDEVARWSERESVANWCRARTLELVFTAWDLRTFGSDHGWNGSPFRWDEKRRFLLRCELDAAFFHLYGLERDDVDYVMDTFPIVRRKDMQAHSEYRTKRLILEIYDELAEATESGEPYQTRLDPPPADPRVAHPPRATPVEVS